MPADQIRSFGRPANLRTRPDGLVTNAFVLQQPVVLFAITKRSKDNFRTNNDP